MASDPLPPPGDTPRGATEPASAGAPGFLGHVLNYGAVSVLQKAVALAMLPLYTRWLVTAEYGVIAITDLLLVVLAELFGRHLLAGMARQYFLAREERGRRAAISTTTLVVAAAAWVVCGIALAFRHELTPLVLGRGDSGIGPERLVRLVTLALLTLPCQLTSQAGFGYLLIRKRSRLWAGTQLAKMSLELVLKITLVGVLGWGVEGFLTSILVGEALAALAVTGAVLAHVGVRVERAVLAPILRFALPLVPVGVFQLGLHQLDRRLLEHLAPEGLGLAWAGIYGLGYLVATTPVSVLLNALFSIWQPSIYAIEDPGERRRVLARDTTWTVLVLAGVCALTCLAGRPLVDLLAGRPDYRIAHEVVPWVACGAVLWGLYAAIQLAFYAERKTASLILMNGVALAANVGLNYAWIPRYGYVGAAGATLAAFGLLALSGVLISRRVCPVPFETGRLASALAVAAAAGITGIWVDGFTDGWTWLGSVAFRTLLLVGFAALLLGPLLRPSERNELRRRMGPVFARLGLRG